MDKIDKKTNFDVKQLVAIERIACDPGLKTKQLSDDLKVDQLTIRKWRNDINFIEAVYDRFTEVVGKHLPDVIMGQIREAKLGSTPAATLILKHAGKLNDTLTLQITSPWDKWLKLNNIEEAELLEEDAIEIGNSFELPGNTLIDRDPSNDLPKTKVRRENKKIKEIYSRQQYLDNRNERYHWLKRAKRVGIEPLGRGRPNLEKLRSWHNSIIKAENDFANGIVSNKQKSPD